MTTPTLQTIPPADHHQSNEDDIDDAFPIATFPFGLRFFIEGVTSQSRVPVELSAVTALSVISASVGAGVVLNSGEGRTLRPNLFFLVGMLSGLGKSVTFDQMAEPLAEEQERLVDIWKLKSAESDTALPMPALTLTDATSESVAASLSENHGSAVGIISPDARGAIAVLEGRYQKSGGMDIGVYLNGWTGDTITYKRKTGPSFYIRKPCLSAMLYVQPDKLSALCSRDEFEESGLAGRFLMMRMGSRKPPRGKPVDPGDRRRWNECISDALFLRRMETNAHEKPIDLSPEAEAVRDEFEQYQDALLESNAQPGIRSVTSRLVEQAMRIALVLHVARNGRRAREFPVMKEDMIAGEAVARWFYPRASELLAEVSVSHAEKLKKRVARIFAEKKTKLMTLRELRKEHGVFEDQVDRLVAAFPAEFRQFRTRTADAKGPGGRMSPVLELAA
jgi:hypothetical protein